MMITTLNGKTPESFHPATSYYAAGFSVVPIRTDGSKAPSIGEWKTLQTNRLPADRLNGLFNRQGVGIVGGAISGGLTVIDNDEPALWSAFCEACELEAPGLLERLPHVQTPKNGHHLYLRCDGPTPGNEKLAMGLRLNDHDEMKPKALFETRGEGGYVVAPGSPADCHERKKTYEHISGPTIEQTPTITVAERDLLFRIARSFNELSTEPMLPASSSSAPAEPRVGDDYNRRATWEELLTPHGWTKLGTRGPLTQWRRPGKDVGGCSATTGCLSQTGNDLLCIFSSNAYPFDVPSGATHGTYSKFAAYAVLNHRGDYSEATRSLSRAGFGPPPSNPKEVKAKPPLQFDYLPWRDFPTEVLPEPLRNLVERGAEAIGVDPTFLLLPALATAATGIGNTRRVTINETWSEPAVVWSVIVGDAGRRKSPPFKTAIKPLEERQDRLDAEHPVEDENAPRRAVIATDCTIQRLAGLLNDNPRGVGLIRDELSSWFAGLTRYRREGSDAADWLELFCDGRLHIHRKTGEPKYIHVRMANVSIAGTIQPEPLQRCLANGNTENGLASRFLFTCPPKRLATKFPCGLDERTQRKWRVVIERLLNIELEQDEFGTPQPVLLPLSDEAATLWWQFYAEHQQRLFDSTGAYAGALSKLERYCLRFALIYHMLNEGSDPCGDDSAPITAAAMQSAITTTEWFIHETGRIYGIWTESEEQAEARRVVDWLQSRGGRSTIGRMIRSRLFRTTEEAEAALSELAKAGIVATDTVIHNGPGRPATEYVLQDSDLLQHMRTELQ